ncbi:hypothetical protein MNBD_CHLOROFLEXI01-5232 [hydrothermal vent metagenome]|uniref:Uncharacterized protein n=1 Tax=hydrothermal vent metagenome TaxID=652676 RepID=A0A3B0VL07_9ZZZZ
MLFAINSMLLLGGAFMMMGILLFWRILRFALSTCEADPITRRLAGVSCLLLLTAGLAFAVMINNIPIQ